MPHPDQVSTDNLRGVARQLGGWLDQSAAAKFRAAGQGSVPPSGPSPSGPSNAPLSNVPLSNAPDAAAPDAAGDVAPSPAFELGESFALYSLGPDDIDRGLAGGEDLTALARATGRWHHQIKVDKKPVGFARSTYKGEADFDVQQIYLSELARYVDEAITWLDEYETKNPNDAEPDPLVRLLAVPAYQVHAFWLCRPCAGGESRAVTSETAAQEGQSAGSDDGESKVLVIDAPPHLDRLRPNTLLGSREFLEAFPGKEQFGGLVFDPNTDYAQSE